jgi:hypothetical protein
MDSTIDNVARNIKLIPGAPLFTSETFNKIKNSNNSAENRNKAPKAAQKAEKAKQQDIAKQKAKKEEFEATNATVIAASKRKAKANPSITSIDSKKTLHESE